MKSHQSILVFTITVLLCACSSKEEVVINNPPTASLQVTDGIDRFLLDASASRDPEGEVLHFSWSTTSGNTVIGNTLSDKAYFMIPSASQESVESLTLTVSDGKLESKSNTSITVPALTQVREFGLGKQLEKEGSNTAPYEWYVDQANSGIYSPINCGPAVVTMAAKWTNPNFNRSVADARSTYRSSGGWWFTNDIINYLNDNQVQNRTISLTGMTVIKDELDQGKIAILCLDMYYLTSGERDEYRLGKFYKTEAQGWGHFIIINGYKIVDGQLLYQAYDPYSFGAHYGDGTAKGKGRFYKSADLDHATQVWWDYAIVVSPDGPLLGGRTGVDTDHIVHMPGK